MTDQINVKDMKKKEIKNENKPQKKEEKSDLPQ